MIEELVPQDHLLRLIGYLIGIRSERRLIQEVQVNVAYRWFAGLHLTQRVPDASTFSQHRRRRFAGTGIEQDIFDVIVEQAIGHDLIGGQVLCSDSTHPKVSTTDQSAGCVTRGGKPQGFFYLNHRTVDAATRSSPIPV